MEDDKHPDLQPLLPELGQESILNFPGDHFGVPEQMVRLRECITNEFYFKWV